MGFAIRDCAVNEEEEGEGEEGEGEGEEEEEGEEGEICSICLGTLPHWANEFTWLACCGKGVHEECGAQFLNSACSQNCPMCRTPTPTSHEEHHKRVLRWAKKGKAWAMNMLGFDFADGRGVSESKEMARLWLEKAAEQGYPDAQYNLGVLHSNGEGGLPVSKEKARVWYEKAAEQGHLKAQFNLAFMHSNGEGGPVSQEHCLFWMTALADEQGYEQATTALEITVQSVCFSCGKTGNMKCCARCKCAFYCSRECQAAAWNGGHKAACKQIRRKQQRAKYVK